jgi:hypothetical protein
MDDGTTPFGPSSFLIARETVAWGSENPVSQVAFSILLPDLGNGEGVKNFLPGQRDVCALLATLNKLHFSKET